MTQAEPMRGRSVWIYKGKETSSFSTGFQVTRATSWRKERVRGKSTQREQSRELEKTKTSSVCEMLDRARPEAH